MAKEFICLCLFYEQEITKEELKELIIDAALELGCNMVDYSAGETEAARRVFLPLYYLNRILDDIHDGLVTRNESGIGYTLET
ncbi:MAG: hypothetical protein IKS72_05090 [Prevotella sp.]|nr:hypothetical protein [Prevotella sp.]